MVFWLSPNHFYPIFYDSGQSLRKWSTNSFFYRVENASLLLVLVFCSFLMKCVAVLRGPRKVLGGVERVHYLFEEG